MTYVANNPILYNAALAGIIAASGDGINPVGGTVAASVDATIVTAAMPIAQAVDQLILGDATITAGGATLVPSTAAITGAQLAKSGLMRQCCAAAFRGQETLTTGLTNVSTIAAGIVAKYNAGIAAPFSLL